LYFTWMSDSSEVHERRADARQNPHFGRAQAGLAPGSVIGDVLLE
jgi:hypothetical protein